MGWEEAGECSEPWCVMIRIFKGGWKIMSILQMCSFNIYKNHMIAGPLAITDKIIRFFIILYVKESK